MIRALKITTMSQDQKNKVKSILNFISITGIVCGAIMSPSIAKPAPPADCDLEINKLLRERQNLQTEDMRRSADLMPEHPVIIDLRKKISKLNI
jgi:capsular polysaccharide biosynthesis protein